MQNETFDLVDKAVSGDKQALENLLLSVKDLVFNLSLRMLGTIHDAEDATQEIMIRVITQLSTFRKKKRVYYQYWYGIYIHLTCPKI